MEYNKQILNGEILKQMRLFRKLSVAKMAEFVGLSRQRVYDLEKAKDYNFSTIQVWCNALKFEIHAFPKEGATKESLNVLHREQGDADAEKREE